MLFRLVITFLPRSKCLLILISWWQSPSVVVLESQNIKSHCFHCFPLYLLWSEGTKITADGDCSHEIKRRLLLGRKVMTNLDSIFESRDIILPTKVHLVKAMGFQWSCMHVRVGLWRRLSAEELMLLNHGVGEDSWESIGQQEYQTINPKGNES